MKAALLILALCTSQAAGAQTQQKPFLERFDEALFVEAVKIMVEENLRNGSKMLEVYTESVSPSPISDEQRFEMIKLFGMSSVSWVQRHGQTYGPNSEFSLGYGSLDGNERQPLKELVKSKQYADDLSKMAIGGQLDSIRRYMDQDLADLPSKVGIVEFPKVDFAPSIRWYFFFRITKEKKWRLEYAIPSFDYPRSGFGRTGTFLYTATFDESLGYLDSFHQGSVVDDFRSGGAINHR